MKVKAISNPMMLYNINWIWKGRNGNNCTSRAEIVQDYLSYTIVSENLRTSRIINVNSNFGRKEKCQLTMMDDMRTPQK